ncbi:MAG: [acyl-carrier-protein] S-malonyltransferase [Betaproteobacteria bacterium]|nr:[acyl-carrier-protein] S-malonyltransferase [Betaproteobacteria bacterium]
MAFPGQGSQSVGMMSGYGDIPAIRNTLAEASDVLGVDVAKLISEGPIDALNLTINTQPVMVTAGVACYRAWEELGGMEPVVVAGHSLGEYAALVVAGSISLADCLPLVRLRGQSMQEAVPPGRGAMAAILGLDDETVRQTCAAVAEGEVVEAVNFNSPGQVVIAGDVSAVLRAVAALKQNGAKRAVRLPVSAPFHSSLMAPVATRLREALERIDVKAPRIPVIQNVDAGCHNDPSSLCDALVRQADHPVRWVECVQEMAAMEVTHLFECGPGRVLAPLAKRICDSLHGLALADRSGLEQGLELFRR